MKYLLIILLIVACDSTKQCQKAANKAIKGGCLKVDSFETVKWKVRPEINHEGYVPVRILRLVVDTLSKKDSCFTQNRIETIIKYASIEPVEYGDTNYQLDIWLESGVIRYQLHIKKDSCKEITKTTGLRLDNKCPDPSYWKYWIAIVLLSVAVLGLIFSKFL